MTLEATLAELAERRERFKDFRDSVDEDLARQRVERLAAETAGINALVIQAAAENATLGQIKRAYGTKDHRTISTIVKEHGPEIAALRANIVSGIKDQPEWFTLDLAGDGEATVRIDGDVAVYSWSTMDDGQFLFTTAESLWDPTYTVSNKAVELLDGKTEAESAEARTLAKFIRKSRRTT